VCKNFQANMVIFKSKEQIHSFCGVMA
jgi:hypothetical protein